MTVINNTLPLKISIGISDEKLSAKIRVKNAVSIKCHILMIKYQKLYLDFAILLRIAIAKQICGIKIRKPTVKYYMLS